jgi:hypothetical protein
MAVVCFTVLCQHLHGRPEGSSETHSVFITNCRIPTQESGKLSRYSDGLRTGLPGFDSRQGLDFSLLHNINTQAG